MNETAEPSSWPTAYPLQHVSPNHLEELNLHAYRIDTGEDGAEIRLIDRSPDETYSLNIRTDKTCNWREVTQQ